MFDDENDKNINNKVIGWVLTTGNPLVFRLKLDSFDEIIIEQYKEDGTGFYQRAIVDVSLDDPGLTIGGAEPIGSSGSVVKAYVYRRPDCSKEERIFSVDWLQR